MNYFELGNKKDWSPAFGPTSVEERISAEYEVTIKSIGYIRAVDDAYPVFEFHGSDEDFLIFILKSGFIPLK